MPSPDERDDWLRHPTRLRMLEAAELRFATDGFGPARVDDIAADAHVSKSHLYYHFDSKQALLEGVIELRLHELQAAREQLFGTGTLIGDADNCATAVDEFIHGFLEPRQAFIRIVVVGGVRNPDVLRPVFDVLAATIDDLVERIAALYPGLDVVKARRLMHHFMLTPTLGAIALDGNDIEAGGGTNGLLADLPAVGAALLRLCVETPDAG